MALKKVKYGKQLTYLKVYIALNSLRKKLQRYFGRLCQTERDRNNHINRPVRTARAVVQHYNAAIHITMHTMHRDNSAILPLPPEQNHVSDVAIRLGGKHQKSTSSYSCNMFINTG